MMKNVGPWAFVLGIVIALLAGFATTGIDTTVVLVLAVLGIIVGFLNVSDKEVIKFLVSTLAFMIAATSLNVVFSKLPSIGTGLSLAMSYIGVFVAPAAAIVAIKALYDIAKE